MGTHKHELTFAELDGRRNLDPIVEWRAALPEDWQALVVGPVTTPINGYTWMVFLPDGSKEGWDASDLGEVYRAEFRALVERCNGSIILETAHGDAGHSVRWSREF